MSEPKPRSRLATWQEERGWAPVGSSVALVLLAVLTAAALPWRTGSAATLLVDGVLCGVTALWILVMFTLQPKRLHDARHMGTFVAVLVLLLIALVLRNAWFGFFTVTVYGVSIKYLPWPWRLAGVSGAALAAAISQTSGVQGPWERLTMFVVALVINEAGVCFLTWFLWTSDKQDSERKRALAELHHSNERLVASITENETLHRRLVAQAREAGIAEERQRMAREIHDTLAQGLTGIVTQLQAAAVSSGQPAEWQRHVSAATQLARESLTEARRSVDALRPTPLESGRLSEALDEVASRWSSLNSVAAAVTTTGEVRRVDPEVEFALLRAAQEALANVARHAQAARVGITISYMENEVALDVRDDGIGFDPASAEHGFGLVAMRQRIAALSGTVQVESEPGGGTAISVCVPTVSGLVRS